MQVQYSKRLQCTLSLLSVQKSSNFPLVNWVSAHWIQRNWIQSMKRHNKLLERLPVSVITRDDWIPWCWINKVMHSVISERRFDSGQSFSSLRLRDDLIRPPENNQNDTNTCGDSDNSFADKRALGSQRQKTDSTQLPRGHFSRSLGVYDSLFHSSYPPSS